MSVTRGDGEEARLHYAVYALNSMLSMNQFLILLESKSDAVCKSEENLFKRRFPNNLRQSNPSRS